MSIPEDEAAMLLSFAHHVRIVHLPTDRLSSASVGYNSTAVRTAQ
jgi:hypothetical protein